MVILFKTKWLNQHQAYKIDAKRSEYYNNLFILTFLSTFTLQKSEKMHIEIFKITITFTKIIIEPKILTLNKTMFYLK